MSRDSVGLAPVAESFSRVLGVVIHFLLWGGAAVLCWRSHFACQGTFFSGVALLFYFLFISSLASFLRELNRCRGVSPEDCSRFDPLAQSQPTISNADFISRHWATILPVMISGFLFFPLFHWRALFLFPLLVVGEILCGRTIPSFAERFFQKNRFFKSPFSTKSSDTVSAKSFTPVHLANVEEELVMENIDEEEDEYGEEEIEPNLLFAQTRRKTSEGKESLEGWVRPTFESFQEVSIVHLPFTPAFREVPSLDLFLIEGEAKLTVTQIEPFGARIEVKRTLSRNEESAENIVVGDFGSDSIRFGFCVEGLSL